MKKGKPMEIRTLATKKVESEVLTEVNHENWICMLYQEEVIEYMVCR
jgi:hypothetical protein